MASAQSEAIASFGAWGCCFCRGINEPVPMDADLLRKGFPGTEHVRITCGHCKQPNKVFALVQFLALPDRGELLH